MRNFFLSVLLLTGIAFVHGARAQDRDDHARSLAATCANCHGVDGRSAGGMPSIAGLSREALVKAMQDFRSGARPATVMHQLAKGYTDEDVAMIADWLARSPRGAKP